MSREDANRQAATHKNRNKRWRSSHRTKFVRRIVLASRSLSGVFFQQGMKGGRTLVFLCHRRLMMQSSLDYISTAVSGERKRLPDFEGRIACGYETVVVTSRIRAGSKQANRHLGTPTRQQPSQMRQVPGVKLCFPRMPASKVIWGRSPSFLSFAQRCHVFLLGGQKPSRGNCSYPIASTAAA